MNGKNDPGLSVLREAHEARTTAAVAGIGRDITERHRSILAALADELIPAGDQMPSATDAGVARAGLDVFLSSRPELADHLRVALEEVADQPPAMALARLGEAGREESYSVITSVIVGSYYLNPEILMRLGYPGQRSVAIGEPALDADDQELVQSVVARGSIFRKC